MSRYTLKHTISPLSWSRFAVVVIIVIIFSIIIIYSAGLFLYRCQFYWDWIPSHSIHTSLSLFLCACVYFFLQWKCWCASWNGINFFFLLLLFFWLSLLFHSMCQLRSVSCHMSLSLVCSFFTRYSLVSVTAAVSAYLCIYERKSAIYPMQHLFTTATQTHTHTRTEYTQRAHEKLTRWYDGVWCRLYNVQLTPICNVHLVTKSKQEWRGSEWECERNECNAMASSSEIHHRKHIYVLHTNSKLPFFIWL